MELNVPAGRGRRARPDVVVVGAGGSGAVLAARLSEDAGRSVLLLESGRAPTRLSEFGPDLLDARVVPGARAGHPAVQGHAVHLTPAHPYVVPRGRVLGGSTTVNGGYFIRARRKDFERWAAVGGDVWSYDRALPFLRALENDLDHGADETHGGSGPVQVRRAGLEHPAAAAFASAARRLGFPEEPDKNAEGLPGYGPVPSNSVDGVRLNTAVSHLLEALGRPNLTVAGDSVVRRILFDGRRVTAVVVERGGRTSTLACGEVVLCAGALNSPHLLHVSGIGPRRALEEVGIPVVAHVPAVGMRFGDHPQVVVEWTPSRPLPAPASSWLGGALHLSSSDGGHPGNLEVLQSLVPLAALGGAAPAPGAAPGLLVSDLSPRLSGRMRTRSADPAVPPAFDYGYLRDPVDRLRLREAVRVAVALVTAPAFDEIRRGHAGPRPAVLRDDRSLDAWIHARLGTSQHTCGTVPMGPADDRHAAVDGYGRVHGVTGLRVADTSILPTAPLRGPAATAVLVGELVADAMRRELR